MENNISKQQWRFLWNRYRDLKVCLTSMNKLWFFHSNVGESLLLNMYIIDYKQTCLHNPIFTSNGTFGLFNHNTTKQKMFTSHRKEKSNRKITYNYI